MKKNKRDLKELERERIESLILEFLRYDSFVSLNLLSDFYDRMCEWLDLSLKSSEYQKNIRKMRIVLKRMKDKKLIDWRRCGTGIGGESTFGMKTLNSYALYEYWNIK